MTDTHTHRLAVIPQVWHQTWLSPKWPVPCHHGNPPQAPAHTAQLLVRFCDVGSRRRRGGQSVQGTFQLLLVNHTNAAAVHVDTCAQITAHVLLILRTLSINKEINTRKNIIGQKRIFPFCLNIKYPARFHFCFCGPFVNERVGRRSDCHPLTFRSLPYVQREASRPSPFVWSNYQRASLEMQTMFWLLCPRDKNHCFHKRNVVLLIKDN